MATPRINPGKSLRPRRQPVSMTEFSQSVESKLTELLSSNDWDTHTKVLREVRDLTKEVLKKRGT